MAELVVLSNNGQDVRGTQANEYGFDRLSISLSNSIITISAWSVDHPSNRATVSYNQVVDILGYSDVEQATTPQFNLSFYSEYEINVPPTDVYVLYEVLDNRKSFNIFSNDGVTLFYTVKYNNLTINKFTSKPFDENSIQVIGNITIDGASLSFSYLSNANNGFIGGYGTSQDTTQTLFNINDSYNQNYTTDLNLYEVYTPTPRDITISIYNNDGSNLLTSFNVFPLIYEYTFNTIGSTQPNVNYSFKYVGGELNGSYISGQTNIQRLVGYATTPNAVKPDIRISYNGTVDLSSFNILYEVYEILDPNIDIFLYDNNGSELIGNFNIDGKVTKFQNYLSTDVEDNTYVNLYVEYEKNDVINTYLQRYQISIPNDTEYKGLTSVRGSNTVFYEPNVIYNVNFTYDEELFLVFGDYEPTPPQPFNYTVKINNNNGSTTYVTKGFYDNSVGLQLDNLSGNVIRYSIGNYTSRYTASIPSGKKLIGYATNRLSNTPLYLINTFYDVTIDSDIDLFEVYEDIDPEPTTGGVTIEIYQNSAEDVRVDKTNYLLRVDTITGFLRESCSLIEPVIQLQLTNVPNFNYVYIPSFNRYYFVSSITSIVNNLWLIEMNVDVLMSYKEQIKLQTAFIDRQEFNVNRQLIDECIPFEQGYSVSVDVVPNKVFKSAGQNDSDDFVYILSGVNVSRESTG